MLLKKTQHCIAHRCLPPLTHSTATQLDTIHNIDALALLQSMPDNFVNCVVTSPPYFGLRSYGVDGEYGAEETPYEYVHKMTMLFREVRRVLRDDGTLWLNLGDSYANDRKWGGSTSGKHVTALHGSTPRPKRYTGLPGKSLIGIPWKVAFALQDDGWILRNDQIWEKPDCMPESVKDRCTRSHEYVFMLTKQPKYWVDMDAIREPAQDWGTRDRSNGKYTSGDVPTPGGKHGGLINGNFADIGRNKRTIWTMPTANFSQAHFAVFPPELPEICILAGCPADGIVLDPFMGSGTTAMVAIKHGRHYIGSELNPDYIKLTQERISNVQVDMFTS